MTYKRIKIINPTNKFYKETGYLLKRDDAYCPNCEVLLDKYKKCLPDISIRYFWDTDLEEIKK